MLWMECSKNSEITPMTQKELEQKILDACQNTVKCLQDSPISKKCQIYNQIGFYQGFCDAQEWTVNLDFINELEDLA